MYKIAEIIVIVVLFHHLGLADELRKFIPSGKMRRAWRCSKCMTFWSVLLYSSIWERMSPLDCLASSFVAALLAIYIEVLLGIISRWTRKIWEE